MNKYKLFAIIRIILTCLPQSGYIHPDEYFQSIEVVAEKLLQVQANRPWEFNATFPIRSISSMYLTVGFSYQILKTIDYFMVNLSSISLITPYFAVVLPRLLMCFLSFIVDWCLYKICIINYEKYQSRCLMLSVSYVMLTYATRTFSNSIELVLFALLLFYVSESIILSTTNIKKYQYLDYRYKTAVGPVQKAKFRKLQLYLKNDSLRNWFVIGTITVVGIFNRPTFIAYAAGPVFFWLYRGIGFRSVSSLSFYLRACLFQIGMIPTLLLYILIDSFYFGYLTWGEIGMLKVSLENFVVTPWNFIKYNFNSANLAKHGLHPRYLHAAVNMPILFGVLTLFCYSDILEMIKHIIQTKYHYLPSIRSIKGLMIISFIIPFMLLSYIPHQEPRFIIPLILPLIYLYGNKVLPECDTVLSRVSKINKQQNQKSEIHPRRLYKTWVLMNIALTVFYGFLHQGGIYSFISHMNTEMKSTQSGYHIVTSHVYSIPESLFLQSTESYTSHRRYAIAKRIIVHEEGSKSVKIALSNITHILQYCETKTAPPCTVHLLMPYTLLEELEHVRYKLHKNLIVKNVVHFYPHISTERLPTLSQLHLASLNFSYFCRLFSLVSIEFRLINETV